MRRYLYNSTEPTVSEEIFDIGSKYLRDGKVKYIKTQNGSRVSRQVDSTDARKWIDVRINVKSVRDGTRKT